MKNINMSSAENLRLGAEEERYYLCVAMCYILEYQ